MNLFTKAKVIEKTKKSLCLHCNSVFVPDKRNLNRGWGLFCSKSCSAAHKMRVNRMSKADKMIEDREKKLRQLGI